MHAPWHLDWPAPAKLNLFLHVIGRRADGYHLLQTAFRFLDHGDSLRFSPRADSQIVLRTPIVGVPPETDLTVRAARRLQQAAGIHAGVDIELIKRLPMGGGLGGGSSDAATVLLALNRLWHAGLSNQELQNLGLSLGADVPIFIHGHSAFAEGVGERFSNITLAPAWYLVLIPPVSVPTAEIFRAPDLHRDTPALSCNDWQAGMGGNDLEPIACRLYPEVAQHLDYLRQFGTARMSGSGACVFVEFSHAAAAQAAHANLPAEMQGFVAAGLDRNPASLLATSTNFPP